MGIQKRPQITLDMLDQELQINTKPAEMAGFVYYNNIVCVAVNSTTRVSSNYILIIARIVLLSNKKCGVTIKKTKLSPFILFLFCGMVLYVCTRWSTTEHLCEEHFDGGGGESPSLGQGVFISDVGANESCVVKMNSLVLGSS